MGRGPSSPGRLRMQLAGLLLLACLTGCGGGGGSSGPEGAVLDLGNVSAKLPTLFELPVSNPLEVDATAEVSSIQGPLFLGPGELPRSLSPGEGVKIAMAIAPQGEGDIDSRVVIRIAAAGSSTQQVTRIVAQARGANMSLAQGSVAFGDVAPGTFALQTATLVNTSSLTGIRITGITSSHPAFSVVTPLPQYVAPASALGIVVRYDGGSAGEHAASFAIASDALNGPHALIATATTGGRVVADLGILTFDGNGDTPAVTFNVPADSIGFMLEASVDLASSVGLRSLTGPGAWVFENAESTGPYNWVPMSPVFVAQVPNSDRLGVQLVPGGGPYTVRFKRVSGSATSTAARVTIQRRMDPATSQLAQLDLNVFLATGIAPTAATAPDDAELQAVLAVCDALLGQQGITLGDVVYYDVTQEDYDDVSPQEYSALWALSDMATKSRLNVFFVRSLATQQAGVASAIGGPSAKGTSASGVLVQYLPAETDYCGYIVAHEIGHFLGLDHTVNSAQVGNNGGYDDILDTAPCPPGLPCADEGGLNVMNGWFVGGTILSNGQGLVMRTHALTAARTGTGGPVFGKAHFPPPTAIAIPAGVPAHWCGVCSPAGDESR